MILILDVGAEDVIPHPTGDAESHGMGFEVMTHVVAAQFLPVAARKRKVVQGIVSGVVGHVTQHETCVDGWHQGRHSHPAADDQGEQQVSKRGERDADRGRHHQAGFDTRLGVMDAVHQEQETLHSFGGVLGRIVKDKAVQQVLGWATK